MRAALGGNGAESCSRKLRPAQRLCASADFTALLDRGLRYSDSRFVIYYRPNSVQAARLGLAVSKRVARKATHRNQLKRLLRESFRHLSCALPPLDIFVLLKPRAALVDRHELRAGVIQAFSALGTGQASRRPSRK